MTQHVTIEFSPLHAVRNYATELPGRIFAASGVQATLHKKDRSDGSQACVIVADVPDDRRAAFDEVIREAKTYITVPGFAAHFGTTPPIHPRPLDSADDATGRSKHRKLRVSEPYRRHTRNIECQQITEASRHAAALVHEVLSS